jgi:translocation and assembly module TamA
MLTELHPRKLWPAIIVLFLALPVAAEDEQSAKVSVSFLGVEGDILENVEASVTLYRQRDMARLTDSRIRMLHNRAPEEIQNALRAFGYYQPVIESELTEDDGIWQASYVIKTGDPVRITAIDIRLHGSGADDDLFTTAAMDHPFTEGARLNHAEYEAFKDRLNRIAHERGYFESAFTVHVLRVDPEAGTASIELEFDTGPRYRFGEVRFSDTPFNNEFLQNYVPFERGTPYHGQGLATLRRTLVDSDLFSSVEVRAGEHDAIDYEVPITVHLEPRKRNRYTAGLGFGTDTGPRGRLGWNARYLNERGHSLNTDLRVSPVISNLSSTYLIPFFRNGPADIGLRTQLSREDTDTADSYSAQLSGFRTRKRWRWNETLSLSYLFEDFDVGGESRSSKLLIAGAGWWRTWADDSIYPLHGGRLSLDLRGSAESPLSDVSFLQARLQGKYVRELGWRNRVLTRLELGATTVSDFDRLPASLRFFAGGDQSIRGFDFQSLGPRDDAGRIIGGRYLIVGSVEYEQFIYRNWGVAAFVDFGNALNNLSDPLEVGTGGGLRWLSPIGMVRLDIGVGVSRDDNPIRLHISIGPDI